MSKNTQLCASSRAASEFAGQPLSHTHKVYGLIRQARPRTAEEKKLLRIFSKHFSAHLGLIPQLASAVDLRLAANDSAASFREACERVRWDTRTHIPNVLVPMYARATVVCYPRLNGRVQFVECAADGALGTSIAAGKLPGEYAPRLQWAHGLEAVLSQPPTQGELFDEVSA